MNDERGNKKGGSWSRRKTWGKDKPMKAAPVRGQVRGGMKVGIHSPYCVICNLKLSPRSYVQ